MFEKMLRNVSAIGGDAHATHMFASAFDVGDNPIITDGPPRHLLRIADRQARLRGEKSGSKIDLPHH